MLFFGSLVIVSTEHSFVWTWHFLGDDFGVVGKVFTIMTAKFPTYWHLAESEVIECSDISGCLGWIVMVCCVYTPSEQPIVLPIVIIVSDHKPADFPQHWPESIVRPVCHSVKPYLCQFIAIVIIGIVFQGLLNKSKVLFVSESREGWKAGWHTLIQIHRPDTRIISWFRR